MKDIKLDELDLQEDEILKIVFLDESCRDAIEEKQDFIQAREEAKKKWEDMTQNEKELFDKKVSKNKPFYLKYMKINPNRINGYNLFTRDRMAKAREKGVSKTISDCAKEWKNLDSEIKKLYNEYAKFVREERSDILPKEIPKRKETELWGPFKYFVDEISSGKLKFDGHFLVEAREMWDSLSEEEKSKYEEIAAKEHHEYVAKMLEFMLQKKRRNKGPNTAFNLFTIDIEKAYADKEYRDLELFDFAFLKWNELDDEIKDIYEKSAETERTEFLNKWKEDRDKKSKDKNVKKSKGPSKKRTPSKKSKKASINNKKIETFLKTDISTENQSIESEESISKNSPKQSPRKNIQGKRKQSIIELSDSDENSGVENNKFSDKRPKKIK
jgi:hypothetical protein